MGIEFPPNGDFRPKRLRLIQTDADGRPVNTEQDPGATGPVNDPWQTAQKISRWASDLLPPMLGPLDQNLVKDWAAETTGSSYQLDAMCSAREAELTALQVYKTLYGQAEDLSIVQEASVQQRSPSDTRWRTADIAVQDEMIDVKNTRRSLTSPHSYSQIAVPRWKLSRSGNDVTISGFYSPYSPHFIATLASSESPATGPVVWLGECTISDLEAIAKDYSSGPLTLRITPSTRGWLLPPWLFDYPEQVYWSRNLAIRGWHNLISGPSASGSDLATRLLTTIVQTKPEYGKLYRRHCGALLERIGSQPLTRPRLFCAVLEHFACCLQRQTAFDIWPLSSLFFNSSCRPPTRSFWFPGLSTPPLCVADPLDTIASLITTLESASRFCAAAALGFEHVELTADGILVGVDDRGKRRTIMAYCGGLQWIGREQRSPCGHSPLHLGRHPNCDACGHLICDRCGHCRRNCPRGCERQEQLRLSWL